MPFFQVKHISIYGVEAPDHKTATAIAERCNRSGPEKGVVSIDFYGHVTESEVRQENTVGPIEDYLHLTWMDKP